MPQKSSFSSIETGWSKNKNSYNKRGEALCDNICHPMFRLMISIQKRVGPQCHMTYQKLHAVRSPQKYEHDAVTRWTVTTCRLRMRDGGYKQSHLSFEPGLKLFWQRFPQVNTSSLIFKPLKKEKNETLTENAQQKNSDSHFYFVTQKINYVPPHLDTIMTLKP